MSSERSWVIVLGSDQNKRRYTLKKGRALVFGRGTDVDIRTHEQEVSRQHAKLEWSPKGVLVTDLESRWGTRINDQEVAQGATACAPQGAVIGAGECTLMVEAVAARVIEGPFQLCMEGGGNYFVLPEQTMVVGRGAESEIRIPVAEISRQHARLQWQKDGIQVTDLESTCGTRVDDETLKPGEPGFAGPGARIQLGPHVLVVRRIELPDDEETIDDKTRVIRQIDRGKELGGFQERLARGKALYDEMWKRSSLHLEKERLAETLAPPLEDEAPCMILSDDQSRAYMVKGELGRGGQGVVYDIEVHGEQEFKNVPGTVARAALKVGKDEEGLLRERLIYMQPHRGIVRILDSGMLNKKPFIVLERLQRHPYSRFAEEGRRTPVDPATAVNTFVNLLDVLTTLHSRKVMPLVLCDIKPDNIMLRMAGDPDDAQYLKAVAAGRYEPVFMDMGCAQHRDELRKGRGRLRDLVGTPVYLPPESIPRIKEDGDFEPGFYSQKTDVYALTLSLYEYLLADRPYAHKGLYQIKGKDFLRELLAHKNDRVLPINLRLLHQRLPDHAKLFEKVLKAGLHPNPERRPSAGQLLKKCMDTFRVKRWKKDPPPYPQLPMRQGLLADIDPARSPYHKTTGSGRQTARR